MSNNEFRELATAQKETSEQIKQVTKQLKKWCNKWGDFVNESEITSLETIIIQTFKTSTICQFVYKKMNEESIEIDIFSYENNPINTVFIVEVKSHLREDSVNQIEETMKNFPKFFPDHADKKLYGIIACVHAPESIKNVLRKKGIYLAVLHDDIFELYPFKNFTPKDYNHLQA